jgi:hypothetical protein
VKYLILGSNGIVFLDKRLVCKRAIVKNVINWPSGLRRQFKALV